MKTSILCDKMINLRLQKKQAPLVGAHLYLLTKDSKKHWFN
jgi:hypothetical protein